MLTARCYGRCNGCDERCELWCPSEKMKLAPITRTPQISLVAYSLIPNHRVFVRVPNERGRWALVDICVVMVECPVCKSAIGEMCKSRHHRYWVDTHGDRRTAYQRQKHILNPDGIRPKVKVTEADLNPGRQP